MIPRFFGERRKLVRAGKSTQRQHLEYLLQLGEESRECSVGYVATGESEPNQERPMLSCNLISVARTLAAYERHTIQQ